MFAGMIDSARRNLVCVGLLIVDVLVGRRFVVHLHGEGCSAIGQRCRYTASLRMISAYQDSFAGAKSSACLLVRSGLWSEAQLSKLVVLRTVDAGAGINWRGNRCRALSM